MAVQAEPKRDAPTEEPDQETRVAIEKAMAEAKVAKAQSRTEEKARLKAEKDIAGAQEALAAAQAKLEEEHQARIQADKGREEAERALAQARKAAMEVEVGSMEMPSPEMEERGAEQRVSFAVRLTVDEQGHPLWTEVEHPKSGTTDKFPSLDVQRLAAFMKACIGPGVIPELGVPPAPMPVEEMSAHELRTPTTGLAISNVQTFRMGDPGLATLTLSPQEAFMVQASFRLQDPEASSLAAKETLYEIKLYANDVNRGKSLLMTTYRENLVKGVLEYTTQLQVTGLSLGLYRLLTLVTLQAPINMAGYYEGPVVEVVEIQPTLGLVAPLEGSLSH